MTVDQYLERFTFSKKPPTGDLNRLFVYGIFLSDTQQLLYGMSRPYYATVEGYATAGIEASGNTIVEAVESPQHTLTGLIVDVDPTQWTRIDLLEGGYERIKIRTTDNDEAWMYVKGIF